MRKIVPIELIDGPMDGMQILVHQVALSIVIPVNYRMIVQGGERFYGYAVYNKSEDGKFRYSETVGEPCEPFGAVWHE